MATFSLKSYIEMHTEFISTRTSTAGTESFIEILMTQILNEYDLQFFCWRGYTPSFNDGEPCTYSGGVDYFLESVTDCIYDLEGEQPDWDACEEEYIDFVKSYHALSEAEREKPDTIPQDDLRAIESLFEQYNEYGHDFWAWRDTYGVIQVRDEEFDGYY